MQNFSIYLHKSPEMDATKVLVLRLENNKPIASLAIDKKTGFIKENKVKSSAHMVDPLLIIPGSLERLGFIQELLGGILQAGYKPKKESIPEETQATKAHLQDMRNIAFNFINMIDKVTFKKKKEGDK